MATGMIEPFQLRRNRRARRLTLHVRIDSSLVVTAPPRVSERQIRAFVAERADWIEAARDQLQAARADRAEHLGETHPKRIGLPAIDRALSIRYASNERPHWTSQGDDVIELRGAQDPADARALLVDVLKVYGRDFLTPRVAEFAAQHGLRPGRITWRNPNTRWGSCSSNGNLSLSVRLLLLDKPVADYVLLHELAHLVHPNHSSAFWAKVETMCSEYRDRKRELKAASRAMPVWCTGHG